MKEQGPSCEHVTGPVAKDVLAALIRERECFYLAHLELGSTLTADTIKQPPHHNNSTPSHPIKLAISSINTSLGALVIGPWSSE